MRPSVLSRYAGGAAVRTWTWGKVEAATFVAPNGLRVLVGRVPWWRRGPVEGALALSVPFGSLHDPAAAQGATHVLEHLLVEEVWLREDSAGEVEAAQRSILHEADGRALAFDGGVWRGPTHPDTGGTVLVAGGTTSPGALTLACAVLDGEALSPALLRLRRAFRRLHLPRQAIAEHVERVDGEDAEEEGSVESRVMEAVRRSAPPSHAFSQLPRGSHSTLPDLVEYRREYELPKDAAVDDESRWQYLESHLRQVHRRAFASPARASLVVLLSQAIVGDSAETAVGNACALAVRTLGRAVPPAATAADDWADVYDPAHIGQDMWDHVEDAPGDGDEKDGASLKSLLQHLPPPEERGVRVGGVGLVQGERRSEGGEDEGEKRMSFPFEHWRSRDVVVLNGVGDRTTVVVGWIFDPRERGTAHSTSNEAECRARTAGMVQALKAVLAQPIFRRAVARDVCSHYESAGVRADVDDAVVGFGAGSGTLDDTAAMGVVGFVGCTISVDRPLDPKGKELGEVAKDVLDGWAVRALAWPGDRAQVPFFDPHALHDDCEVRELAVQTIQATTAAAEQLATLPRTFSDNPLGLHISASPDDVRARLAQAVRVCILL
jgi:hypothetical protein